MKTTLSIIKADIGSIGGHIRPSEKLIEEVRNYVAQKSKGMISDFFISHTGDDIAILFCHSLVKGSEKVHQLAWDTFVAGTKVAKEQGLYGAGQDLLCDAFSGNIKGMGPGVAEMEFTERKAEPIVAFMMDKTEPGAFNFPIFKIFADPFNTAGLIIDPSIHDGFVFEVWDIMEHNNVFLKTPEEMYDLLALVGAKSRFVIKRIFPKKESKLPSDEPVAVISTEKLYQIAGEYVGKDDPAGVVRCQSGLPALGEVIEPFSLGHLVSGWMRGSHNGPLMPVSVKDAQCTRFDGPPRVIALGFQLKDGKLTEPVDLFDDPAYDYTRQRVGRVTDYMRRHGPFEPHRLPMADMEYTTLPKVMKKLGSRFQKIK